METGSSALQVNSLPAELPEQQTIVDSALTFLLFMYLSKLLLFQESRLNEREDLRILCCIIWKGFMFVNKALKCNKSEIILQKSAINYSKTYGKSKS